MGLDIVECLTRASYRRTKGPKVHPRLLPCCQEHIQPYQSYPPGTHHDHHNHSVEPYYTAQHISPLKGDELDVPISDYRYFGKMSFCHRWQQNTRKVGLEVTNNQMQCLYMDDDPKDTSTELTINISTDLLAGMAVASWESNVRVKPVTGGSIPMTISQPNTEPNKS